MKSIEVARLTDESELKQFMTRLLERSPAQETEVMVTEDDSALTRFANNGIHQNVAERDATVRVRVVKDGKTGVASINQMSEAAAADVLKRAVAIADLQPRSEVIPMPGPAKAQPVEPGVYEVVLEEYAVAEMLEFMSFMGFGALAVQEERSFMRLGERITGEHVTIWDDGLDRTGVPAAFDFEGVPKQRVELISNGVASSLVYDMQTATKEGRQSTGHGLPAPNTEGPFAVNLFMKPGSAVKADLVSDIKRGIWVTRFWYVRVVHPKASIITGMTREGTFLIENGKITRPVKDLRFTQSILEALNGTLALTQSTKLQVSEYIGASRVPAVRLKAFDFTS